MTKLELITEEIRFMGYLARSHILLTHANILYELGLRNSEHSVEWRDAVMGIWSASQELKRIRKML